LIAFVKVLTSHVYQFVCFYVFIRLWMSVTMTVIAIMHFFSRSRAPHSILNRPLPPAIVWNSELKPPFSNNGNTNIV